MESLDVVVPVYKARYLPALLECLCRQSSQQFSVIISDDASPEPLQSICQPFLNRLNLRYRRFNDNLGRTDLAAHWNRSIQLSKAEWIIMPGDDDLLDSNCIEAFWRTLDNSNTRSAVYAFGIRTINDLGATLRTTPAAATVTARHFLLQRFRDMILPMPVGYVFSRSTFLAYGGFVSFDSGWHSDDAAWALFGSRTGIAPIAAACVSWRKSTVNLTSPMLKNGPRSFHATMTFLRWLDRHRELLSLSRADLACLTEDISWHFNIWDRVSREPGLIWLKTIVSTSMLLGRIGTRSSAHQLARFVRARHRCSPVSDCAMPH